MDGGFFMRMQFPWRQAAALFLIFLLSTVLWAQARQVALADKVIRLHVVANSDESRDQALKLAVRDRVLDTARPLLAGAKDAAEAEAILVRHLPDLTRAAREALRAQGADQGVEVTLTDAWFPTRYYDDAALPAGTYRALRVVLGEGVGHNWWCVVFPGLCLPAVSEEALQAAGMTDGEIALVTEASSGYVIRFKTVELWGMLKHTLAEHGFGGVTGKA